MVDEKNKTASKGLSELISILIVSNQEELRGRRGDGWWMGGTRTSLKDIIVIMVIMVIEVIVVIMLNGWMVDGWVEQEGV